MISKLKNLSRVNKYLIMVFIDNVLLILSFLIMTGNFPVVMDGGRWIADDNIVILATIIPLIATPIFSIFGLYSALIRYINFRFLWILVKVVSLYALAFGFVYFVLVTNVTIYQIILTSWLTPLLVIIGVRVIVYWIFTIDRNTRGAQTFTNSYKNILIYGAGDAGIQLVSALEYSKEFHSVGFIDDSKELQGRQIKGLSIYSIESIEEVLNKQRVSEVLIAIPSISHARRLSIINKLESYPVSVRVLPGMTELAKGEVSISDVREVDIKDLLGRDMVKPNKMLLSKSVSNMVVVVTGAGGSIGSEICRQVFFLKPKILILYEINELALYTIEKELSNIGIHSIDIYPILGDIKNNSRLSNVFKSFCVDIVYHAAAYKHVPMVEFNNTEGASNNIIGTLNCAQVAINAGVKRFVLISTDKAVRPTSTMGATKRSAELILQALSAKQSNTIFTMVRFGNVLGSSGSVIPLFKQQIKYGGPITVTNKNIVRYFMTVTEAVELVIQAGGMGTGGDVFVLDMGKPVRIDDLAKKMIKLSGLEVKDGSHPNGDIEIKYTGLRPGEKLYEELLIGDDVSDTDNPLIMRAQEDMLTWDELEPIMNDLKIAITDCDQKKLRELLIQIVPGFKPQCEITDVLYKGE